MYYIFSLVFSSWMIRKKKCWHQFAYLKILVTPNCFFIKNNSCIYKLSRYDLFKKKIQKVMRNNVILLLLLLS